MNLKKELVMEFKKSLVIKSKNHLVKYLIFSLCLLNSCSDNDDNYVGTNNAYLRTDKGTTLTVGENQPLNAKLTLSRKVDQDISVKLKITNETNPEAEVIKVNPQNIEIKANTREVSFKITVLDKVSIIEPQTIKISIEEQQLITAKEDLTITVNPAPNIQELTAEQKKLLEGYKKKGMDITPFLGKQKVKTTIISHPEEEGLLGFLPERKQYEGITIIELSKQSTPDQPVLKMTKNPMEMTEAFRYLLEHETILNDTYSKADSDTSYAKLMALIHWNKTSKETFSCSLDSIKIKPPKNGVSDLDYTGKRSYYGDILNVIPFKFSYTAWDRLKKLIKEGNKDAIKYNESGVTSNPSIWLNVRYIDHDEYYTEGKGLFKKTTGVINFKEGTMIFKFLTSHAQSFDYTQVTAEYSIE